ncbi:stalk domain-containing protein [Bacillus sp. Marseille-P3661]|uniref:stalk domain-containing protein n=1 Tax=Bacillus sp. Marseille-P3661 TaxID=1936234 RepID=UPI000C864866|nr:stalk domain-containing protein [Bacillus sp. Marseille-P3661]
MKIIKTLVTIMFLISLIPNNIIANTNYTIIVNEQHVSFQEPLFIDNGRLYVPVRFIGEQLGAAVEWNDVNRTVKIQTPVNDTVTFFINSRKVKVNNSMYNLDVAPMIRYDRAYLPVRHVSEFMHMEVKWIDEHNKIKLTSVPLYEVQQGDSLAAISKSFNTTVGLLKERNNLENGIINPGTKLKVIIPQAMQSNKELELLAKLIQAEAEGESFKAQVAIGNVILNRVADPRFPNTIEEVILQAGQFTPVTTGRIHEVTPSNSAIDAATKAVQGDMPVGDSLYFFNPGKTTNAFLANREVVIDIGSHRFTK